MTLTVSFAVENRRLVDRDRKIVPTLTVYMESSCRLLHLRLVFLGNTADHLSQCQFGTDAEKTSLSKLLAFLLAVIL